VDDLAGFHEAYFRPNNALLVLIGDLSQEEARVQAEQFFGEWQAAEVPDYADYPRIRGGDSRIIYLVDQPDAGEATIRVGNLAIRGAAEDRFPFIVANHVLGGRSLDSRLNLNLRVDKRYTHGIRSNLEAQQDTGAFMVGGTFGQDVAGASVREILAEIERLRTELLTAQELNNAKSFLTAYYLTDTSVPAAFANRLATNYLLGLPWKAVNEYVGKIEAVTATQVREAARRYMQADQPVIVVVGNAAVIQPQLQAMGEVVVVDEQGEPVE
jgi:zinc protease